MKQLIILAWRNIWRSKRRTLITISSVLFALFFAILMRSFQLGTYNHMIFQTIESYTGYLQIQHPDYFADPQLDNAFSVDSSLNQKLSDCREIRSYTSRINAFALVSSGEKTKGALINAIDPENEKRFSNYEERIVRYQFTANRLDSVISQSNFGEEINQKIKSLYGYSFTAVSRIQADLKLDRETESKVLPVLLENTKIEGMPLTEKDSGIMVSDRLAKFLNVYVGDTIIIMAPGYRGTSANGLFAVRAIIKMPTIELDNKLIYMTKYTAESFFGMEGMATTLAINLFDNKEMKMVQQKLQNELPAEEYLVKNWHELNPTLKQQIDGDNVSGIMFLAILYMIVFFGIFGTVLMMVMERRREMAVLISIGMARFNLWKVLLFELVIIGLLGAILGFGSTIPLIAYGFHHPIQLTGEMAMAMEDMGFDPIMPLAWFDAYFYRQAAIVLIMVLITSLIPLYNIYRLKVVNAIKA